MGNGINTILYLFLAIVIFSFAYSYTTLSDNVLRGNDISYGIYIYHIPVVNLFMYYGYVSNLIFVFSVLSLTILMAWLSWIIIEKNSIKLKRHPLNPLNSSNN